MEVINAIGRRKTAVARVYVTEGKGSITVNKRDFKEYFSLGTLQYVALQPLNLIGSAEKYDIKATVNGGGFKGQAEALRLAISRTLLKINEEEYRPKLKAAGFLTRDPRQVERKKPGRPKARKRFQFSKR